MHYIADQTQKSGGALSPEARALLRALNAGAQGPGTASGTPSADSRTVDHERHGHLLGAAEAAKLLGCTRSYFRRLCRSGALPAQRLSGGWVVEAAALDDHRYGRQEHGKPGPTPPA
ncbi:helix-turn-helix domain-containing protein [Streptomyces sp. NPDC059957]|uniref:helix-turn-helix domain-containing protein n=1 Tax=unclassified Streptomyces TaxID=2593676 RepID=UPI003663C104